MVKRIIILISMTYVLAFAASSYATGYSSFQTGGASQGYSSHTAAPNVTYATARERSHDASLSIDFPNVHISIPNEHHHRYKTHHAYRWVYASHGAIPAHAVSGGYEWGGQPLYICQTNYRGGVHPGKIVGHDCHISYGGAEVSVPNYRVLVMRTGYRWVSHDHANIEMYAIPGGYENGQPLYICKADHSGGVHPGKVINGRCYFGYAGREESWPFYDVLVS